jgi:hypothetical protein
MTQDAPTLYSLLREYRAQLSPNAPYARDFARMSWELDQLNGVTKSAADYARIWRWSRTTAWRFVRSLGALQVKPESETILCESDEKSQGCETLTKDTKTLTLLTTTGDSNEGPADPAPDLFPDPRHYPRVVTLPTTTTDDVYAYGVEQLRLDGAVELEWFEGWLYDMRDKWSHILHWQKYVDTVVHRKRMQWNAEAITAAEESGDYEGARRMRAAYNRRYNRAEAA